MPRRRRGARPRPRRPLGPQPMRACWRGGWQCTRHTGRAWVRPGAGRAGSWREGRDKKKTEAEKSAERGRARLGKPSFLSGTPPGAARAPLPRNKTHPPVEDGSMICRRSNAMASPPCTDCQQAEESGPRCRRRRDALNSRRRTSSGVPLAPRTAMMPHIVAGWTVLCVCVWKRSGGAVGGWCRPAGARAGRLGGVKQKLAFRTEANGRVVGRVVPSLSRSPAARSAA